WHRPGLHDQLKLSGIGSRAGRSPRQSHFAWCGCDIRYLRPGARSSNRYWRREIVKDSAMATTLGFLRRSIAKVSQAESLDSREFGELISEVAVLRPADP